MSENFEKTSFLFGSNSIFIEELYQKYLEDPKSIDVSWQEFFHSHQDIIPFKTTSKIIIKEQAGEREEKKVASALSENSLRARFMIDSYRKRGHYLANLDPLGLEVVKTREELNLNIEDFGFTADQMNEVLDITGEFSDIKNCTLAELKQILDTTYSGSIAAEFAHVESTEQQKWLFNRFEDSNTHISLSVEDKKKILQDLVEVEGFEQYLHKKFPGAKRFSVEGGDASIVCLDRVIELSATAGAEDAVLGLAHRGRLSTLTKVMQKPYTAVLSEFMGASAFPDDLGIAGDVKYHMGYSSDRETSCGKKIHLSLTPNPSHLEAVNPVVAGKVRAKQDFKNSERNKVVGILVHGDAAFCGQGVVAESLIMSSLEPYDVGGIFHLVINNQIGFTTDNTSAKTSRYCTEVAKMVGAPIIHVNGDDIEAVIMATNIACEYRQKFGRDVVVDIICYRKYGHNEGDEPMYTQSIMYNVIKTKITPAAIYAQKLVTQQAIDDSYYGQLKQEFKAYLDTQFAMVEGFKPRAQWLEGNWSGFDRSNNKEANTGVKKSILQKLGASLCKIPQDFALNKKLAKLFQQRAKVLAADEPIDWATAEQLAFATLLNEGTAIRMTGQDVQRGTFSHRHAVLHSQTDGSIYQPLNNMSQNQALIEISNSNLSEYGVLGFEYGYSLVSPQNLVIWEAQFGDFVNGAQIMIDQFIASAETKWLRMSGLVMLLPHGFEGQGPEHSSARLERFLQLTAEDNIQVVYPTTPASIFHLLRRQVKRNFRKPLIVMSPKSILRHKLVASKLSELSENTKFIPILDEIDKKIKSSAVKKVIFCTGKVYYDLVEMRSEAKKNDVVVIRFEQLYPYKEDLVRDIIKKYKNAKEFIWCQEEPQNMGSWDFIASYLQESLQEVLRGHKIKYVGRPKAASPAAGYLYVHNKQQELLVKKALGLN
ncbi:MAG: 2-oxoglutarate dehydrogenase E1 component [Rickettsiaceae bacterium]|nr:2-oxoglutarate dehydrogenase E1 component [Rickettsiaceae bacterium]